MLQPISLPQVKFLLQAFERALITEWWFRVSLVRIKPCATILHKFTE